MYQLLSLGVMNLLGVDNVGHGANMIEPITGARSTDTGCLHIWYKTDDYTAMEKHSTACIIAHSSHQLIFHLRLCCRFGLTIIEKPLDVESAACLHVIKISYISIHKITLMSFLKKKTYLLLFFQWLTQISIHHSQENNFIAKGTEWKLSIQLCSSEFYDTYLNTRLTA